MPATGNALVTTVPLLSSQSPSPSRSQPSVVAPVDVEVNVTVSPVSGPVGEYVNEATGGSGQQERSGKDEG